MKFQNYRIKLHYKLNKLKKGKWGKPDKYINFFGSEIPSFKAGDSITVFYKIKEGDKERIQFFKGDVLQRRGSGATETFTIRKISNGIAVERIFPINSPSIDKIEVNKKGKVRRARIFYLRDLTGKKARIKELKKK